MAVQLYYNHRFDPDGIVTLSRLILVGVFGAIVFTDSVTLSLHQSNDGDIHAPSGMQLLQE